MIMKSNFLEDSAGKKRLTQINMYCITLFTKDGRTVETEEAVC
jgi:hypothetical protein